MRKANLSRAWLVIPPALHGEFLMVLRPLGGQYQRQGGHLRCIGWVSTGVHTRSRYTIALESVHGRLLGLAAIFHFYTFCCTCEPCQSVALQFNIWLAGSRIIHP